MPAAPSPRGAGAVFASVVRRTLQSAVATVVPAAVLCAQPTAAQSVAQSVDGGAAAAAVVQKTNAFRAAHRLDPLSPDPRLAEAARRFAEYMADSDRYGHEADGRKPEERARAQGYDYCLLAENIAYQFSSSGFATEGLAARLVDSWEASPEHRRNMLLAQAVDIGVGLARSAGTGRWYAVQMFGRPTSAAKRFAISNRADAPVRYELDGQPFTLAPRATRTHRGCFGGLLEVHAPDGPPRPGIEPRDGAQYVVERGPGGQWRVQTQVQ